MYNISNPDLKNLVEKIQEVLETEIKIIQPPTPKEPHKIVFTFGEKGCGWIDTDTSTIYFTNNIKSYKVLKNNNLTN